MKTQQITGFADIALSRRKIKEDFFQQINTLIDWKPIERFINRYYKKGESVSGRPGYAGLILFKMTLLQTWYHLSDYEVEDQVNDRISFSRFVGISMDGNVPDHSVVSRFRTTLTQVKAYDKLLDLINKQLESHHILVRTGVIVDASVSDTARKPKGKKVYQVVEDRKEDESITTEDVHLQAIIKPSVDQCGRWLKKAGKLHYGFKRHTGVDENGLVLAVVTTAANESDTLHLEDVLTRIHPKRGSWVKADKGYKSKANDEILKSMKLKNRIMRKADKKVPLSYRAQSLNKAISKVRYKVERTFGSMKRWFEAGKARYIGLEKMHTQHLMESIAYNLYRSPAIAMSRCER